MGSTIQSVCQVLYWDINNIEAQLESFKQTLSPNRVAIHQVAIGASTIPLRAGSEEHAFLASKDAERMADETGLVAMLRNKDDIDMPALLRNSRRIVWFAGYSVKLTFMKQPNVEALADALSRQVSVKVLIADPLSEIARLRSLDPLYATPNQLILDINNTISAANDFHHKYGSLYYPATFDVRRSACIPPCSYFFIDNFCVSSFYSRLLSGGKAPCMIFRATDTGWTGYYEILRQEFLRDFESATTVLESNI